MGKNFPQNLATFNKKLYLCPQIQIIEVMEENKSTIVSEPAAAYDTTSYVMPRSSLISMLSSVGIEDIPMAIRYLVDKLAAAQRKETADKSAHIWDNYELSAEIIAMAPAKRKSIFGDYEAELTEILEEKYFTPV